jgi:HEAT repeat protein
MRTAMMLLLLGLAPTASAQDSPELEALIQTAARYKTGDPYEPLAKLADAVARSQPDAGLAEPLAAKLAAMMADPEATFEGRQFAARQLWLIASPRQVPALAGLLGDAELGDMARYALERMEGPEAAAALRDALGRVRGPALVGVIDSLGRRADPAALPALQSLSSSSDPAVAAAAARAVETLDASPSERGADPLAAQAAQFRSKIASLPENLAVAPLTAAMADASKPHLASLAVRMLERSGRPEATVALIDAMNTANPAMSEQILLALGARGDRVAAPVALRWAESATTPQVQLAAVQAVGRLGDASAVPVLASLLASPAAPVAAAARDALARLNDPKVDAAILQAAQSGEERASVALIKSLTARRASGSGAALIESAGGAGSSAVRRAAFDALGDLADTSLLPRLVALIVAEKDESVSAAAENAAAAVARRIADEQARLQPILAPHAAASGPARAALLRVLGKIGGPAALPVVRADLDAADPATRDAAIRALADWSDATAAADLLALSASAAQEKHQLLALRGYIRLASTRAAAEPGEALGMFRQALAAARRIDEKRLILAGLSQLADEDAAELAGRIAADEPKLGKEADAARTRIAKAQEKSGKKKNK